MEIKEVTGNLKEFMSGNGGKIAIAVCGGFILYALIKNVSGGTTLVAPSAYSSYPDADKNANTIIDSVNQHTSYENELTRDTLDTIHDDMNNAFDTVNKNLESTNGYIKDGMESLNKNLDKWGNDLNSNISSVGSSVSTTISGLNSTISSMGNTISDLQNQNKQQQDYIDSKLNDIKNAVDSIDGVPSPDTNFWDGMGIGAQSIDGIGVVA